MDASVTSHLLEMRIGREVVLFGVFQDECPAGAQQCRGQDQARQLFHFGQSVGRIGKNKVELFPAGSDVFEYIAFDGDNFVCFQFADDFLDESVLDRIVLYRYYFTSSAASQFETDGSCSGEKVERFHPFKVELVGKDVEEVFPGKIGCRPRFYVAGHVKTPSSVFSADDSHDGLLRCYLLRTNIVKGESRDK